MPRRRLALALLLVLIYWWSRLPALQALPLHTDEGLHLRRAIEVWNLHPFWEIRDGKIINHWLIALFYPQHAPDFVGRIATVFVGALGLAAGLALAWRGGLWAGVLAGLLWIGCPYLFFYERLALSDAEAGALVVVAVWAGLRLAETGRARHALLAGLALAGAALFKLTAVPFALGLALIVLFLGRGSLRRRIAHLAIITLVVIACFALPLLYLGSQGDTFGIALGWLAGNTARPGSAGAAQLLTNLRVNGERLIEQFVTWGAPLWAALMLLGLGALPLHRMQERRGPILLLALALPMLAILVIGADAMPRHFVVGLPLTLTLGGAGLGAFLGLLPRRWRAVAVSGGAAAMLITSIPALTLAYTDVAAFVQSPLDRYQFVTDHPSGYGLREAVRAFPAAVERGVPILGNMFPDSCVRANFYAAPDYRMRCFYPLTQLDIENALAEYGRVFILSESAPIGADVQGMGVALGAETTLLARYPRPDESGHTASVTLWRLRRDRIATHAKTTP